MVEEGEEGDAAAAVGIHLGRSSYNGTAGRGGGRMVEEGRGEVAARWWRFSMTRQTEPDTTASSGTLGIAVRSWAAAWCNH